MFSQYWVAITAAAACCSHQVVTSNALRQLKVPHGNGDTLRVNRERVSALEVIDKKGFSRLLKRQKCSRAHFDPTECFQEHNILTDALERQLRNQPPSRVLQLSNFPQRDYARTIARLVETPSWIRRQLVDRHRRSHCTLLSRRLWLTLPCLLHRRLLRVSRKRHFALNQWGSL